MGLHPVAPPRTPSHPGKAWSNNLLCQTVYLGPKKTPSAQCAGEGAQRRWRCLRVVWRCVLGVRLLRSVTLYAWLLAATSPCLRAGGDTRRRLRAARTRT